MSVGPEEKATRIASALLLGTDTPTNDEVAAAVDHAISITPGLGADSRLKMIKELEAAYNIHVPAPSTLEGDDDHVEWLSDRRAEIRWNLWRRYQRYLEDVKRFPPAGVRRLNEVTDGTLRHLEDPARGGSWDRRGMVVGHVQSGKTANYTGLICKAADAGYKLIIVLAGIHNSLRSQTQLRLDEGFLGYDTQNRMEFDQTNTRIGAGLVLGFEFFRVNSLTNSSEKGDFNRSVATKSGVVLGGDPLLLVVKKHKTILNNVIKWATLKQQQLSPGSSKLRVPHVPLLVIDDECDHASVNTRDTFDDLGQFDPEVDPTAINGCIRRLLDSFEQSAYVGYTATPFANIFIYEDAASEAYGEDLFPRSFITNLKRPSDYVGATRVFGLDENTDAGLDYEEALPIVRTVSDADVWLPSSHKKDYVVPDELPTSLRKALLSFVIACAARAARGQQREHNSMLVHVTRFVDVQAQVSERLLDVMHELKDRLEFGEGARTPTLLDELRDLWEADFVVTTDAFGDDAVNLGWAELQPLLHPAAAKVEVRTINGTAQDALEYYGKPNGVSVIAVGGDKLSRGLTLEGLSVSYYLRTSRMYDTLLQMGRWFGYRPGYTDLCRLFTTAELQRWYKDIAASNEELLKQFDEMALTGERPQDFGLRVKNSPDGLMITAAAKLRTGKKLRLSFSGSISETIMFSRDPAVVQANAGQIGSFVRLLTASYVMDPSRPNNNLIWNGVRGQEIVDLLTVFRTHEGATKAQARVLAQYILQRLGDTQPELTEWTVGLISNSAPRVAADVGGHRIGCTVRNRFPEDDEPLADTYAIRRLLSPSDEAIDLTESERAHALAKTVEAWELGMTRSKRTTPPDVASGTAIRRVRPVTRGLLLIYPLDPAQAQLPQDSDPVFGVALSFPWTPNSDGIEYTVTNRYWEQEASLG
jgi:hypothetical protein